MAIARDEDVARLQVAVDDQALVRVLDGGADVGEKAQAGGDVQVPVGAVLRDRQPVHELHHQVRPAIAGDAAVEQPGDVGMDEAGEDAPLGEEPLVQRIAGVARADQLDRDAMFEVRAGPVGEIDGAHAAAADLRDDAVGADVRRRGRFDHLRDRAELRRPRVHDPGRLVGDEQRAHLCGEIGIGLRPGGEERLALSGRRRPRGRETVLQLPPAVRVHGLAGY